MKIMPCPLNGPRNIQEFICAGMVEPHPDPNRCSDEEWTEFVWMEENRAGVVREWWCHVATAYWFIAERNTVTDEILATYPADRVFSERVTFEPLAPPPEPASTPEPQPPPAEPAAEAPVEPATAQDAQPAPVAPAPEAPAGDAVPVEDTPPAPDDAPAAPAGDVPAEDATVEDAPSAAEEAPAEDVAADGEAPADEASANEVPEPGPKDSAA